MLDASGRYCGIKPDFSVFLGEQAAPVPPLLAMFSEFLARLAAVPPLPHVLNPYQECVDAAAICQSNLQRYLHKMIALQPQALLVGEALGYRGGRLTGVPFTSPHLLKTHPFFGEAKGFRRPYKWPHIQKEATATMVWETLSNLPYLPLLWNAFPFHPHRTGNPQSNRPPTKSEMAWGRPFLQKLGVLFPIHTIIAVGRKADLALTEWQLPHHTIRHPSHGGKQDFVAGINALLDRQCEGT